MNQKGVGLFAAVASLFTVASTLGAAEPNASSVVSLVGGPWQTAADPRNVGREEAWWKAPRTEARPVRVPGIMQEALPGYHGVAWFWREFGAPPSPYQGGRCWIRFHAVDYLAQVWINDQAVGSHEGGETPFTLDITDVVRAAASNRLAVRVLNPTAEPIDGIVLGETPHRNKVPAGIGVGGSYNSGGITEPVEVFWTPAVRLDDVFVQPDWRSGAVRVQVSVVNTGTASVPGRLQLVITAGSGDEPVASRMANRDISVGTNEITADLLVNQHRLWQLDDPFLYRLTTRLTAGENHETHEQVTRFGFRDLRVEHGYFHLNGRRIFLKSSHTGNHCPFSAVLPPERAPDLLRRDLVYMKAAGFNMVRFISGLAHPEQLDFCDELGLMVYEENMASWLLADSPKMGERFDANLREMILRDRNHPSLGIFGLVNEMGNGPMVRHAVASLGLARSLDSSRLILQQSGRWDGQYQIGSVCNPGSTKWEHVWGAESPEYQGSARSGPWGGYFEGAGDAHVYPSTPHAPSVEQGIRRLGSGTKPVFLSEYGIGSLMNAIRERRFYEQYGANPEWDDTKFFRQTEEKFVADWRRLGMDDVYAFPEEMLRASQQLHCRQRALGFNLIRSNARICGYNLTGLLDHGYTGEGLWTFWREFKPGIMDTLQEGWAPLRWCLFALPSHAYVGRPVRLEVVLANEGALAAGTYPVWLRVLGPSGVVWEKKLPLVVPDPGEGTDGPLAIPVFSDDVILSGPAGAHTFAATLERGGAPAAGRLTFYLSEPPAPAKRAPLASIALPKRILTWLETRGQTPGPFDAAVPSSRQIILVGNSTNPLPIATRTALLRRVAEGSTAVFLDPGTFRKDKDPVGWLPLKNKGRLTSFSDWLYHKECVARRHPLFAELAPAGIMDWDYYGPLISNRFFEGQETPSDVAAAAFAVCHSSRPDGYAAGVMLGAYRFGAGTIVLNTFSLLENVDLHPAADRLLLNLITYGAEAIERSGPAPSAAEIEALLREGGY